ncbi:hypothetical protein NECAME_13309 [Necator americanus]|uniref:Uncharacterized protein n=1 Tax=Necator americanus TaxID=51031 RepID=W2SYG1_NECAM|nr:hypothetical protein NECAME_13309 [Necator americanus]ETN73931.1 hypothetical protein NECAME_13309 [Necator americanus]
MLISGTLRAGAVEQHGTTNAKQKRQRTVEIREPQLREPCGVDDIGGAAVVGYNVSNLAVDDAFKDLHTVGHQ